MDALIESQVAIVESDPTVRAAFQSVIEAMGLRPRPFETLTACEASYDSTTMTCVLVGAHGDGAEELNQIELFIEEHPAARIILLTEGSPTHTVVRAMRAGVSNLLEHPFQFDELCEALKLAQRENAEFLEAERQRVPDHIANLLTPQEEVIAVLLLRGAATKEIASKLDLSVRTIHYRKNNIFKKIGAETREQAIKILTHRSIDQANHQAAG